MAGNGLGKIPALGGTSKPKAPTPETAPVFGRTTGRPESGFRKPTVFPRGPEILHLGQKRRSTGGPSNPPAGFVTATTSAPEWYWYWGSCRKLAPGLDPRKTGPPFVGIPGLFDFQQPDNPADVRSIGTYVSDFVYHLGTGDLVVRIDTYRYHIATEPDQIARDLYQKLHGNSDEVIVISAFDHWINDPTGRAVCAAVAEALAGREPINPARGGNAYQVRDTIKTEPSP